MTARPVCPFPSCTSAQTQPKPNPNDSPHPNANPLEGSRSAGAVPWLRHVFRRLFSKNKQLPEIEASTNQTYIYGVQHFFSHRQRKYVFPVSNKCWLFFAVFNQVIEYFLDGACSEQRRLSSIYPCGHRQSSSCKACYAPHTSTATGNQQRYQRATNE